MIFKKVDLAKIEKEAPEAYQALAKFYQTHGTASFYFLCHTALPLFFRLDWLHHLWANFRGDIAQKIRQDVPYHTIADVLQTPFLATIGKEMYEFETTVRDFLLSELETEFGEAHLHKLATFLYQYADNCVPQSYEQQVYHLSTWSVKNPQEATRIVAEALQHLFDQPPTATDHADHTRMLCVLQSIASPAQDKTPYEAIEKIAQRNYDVLNEEINNQKYTIVAKTKADKNTLAFNVPKHILEGLNVDVQAEKQPENTTPEAIQTIEKIFGVMEKFSIDEVGDKKNKGAYAVNEAGEVIALVLREKKIKDIEFLRNFPYVEKLYLAENNIKHLTPIESLVHLTYLGLKDNLIEDVTPIQSLVNLVYLGLKNNKITHFPIDFFTHLPHLEQLFLTENDIINVPITIRLMKGNVLDELKKHFENLQKKRKKIVIEVAQQSSEASDFSMQQEHENSNVFSQKTSQSFGNESNVSLGEPALPKLDFVSADFEGKDEIVLPPYTNSLDLSGILIDESIVELSELTSLTYLKLSDMELSELPFLARLRERESRWEFLEVLDVSNNKLASFPAEYLDLMPNLKELYLFAYNETENNKLPVEVPKDDYIRRKMKSIFADGITPSQINTYVSCSLQYYFNEILRAMPVSRIEERMGQDKLGELIHEVLEDVYVELATKNPQIQTVDIEGILPTVKERVMQKFMEGKYVNYELTGENFIVKESAITNIEEFLKSQIAEIHEKREPFHILALEDQETITGEGLMLHQRLSVTFPLLVENEQLTVTLKGRTDRIDKVRQKVRIIDYKTGKVDKKQLSITKQDLDKLVYDREKDKVRQLWIYKYIIAKQILEQGSLKIGEHTLHENTDLQAGIYSFRNLGEGFLELNNKEGAEIFPDNLREYVHVSEDYLSQILQNMLDPTQKFARTDDTKVCEYCVHRNNCGR